MQITENHFKKFLVDEVMRASKNTSAVNALDEVNNFSFTEKYKLSFEQWKQLKIKNVVHIPRPRHISEIVGSIINAY